MSSGNARLVILIWEIFLAHPFFLTIILQLGGILYSLNLQAMPVLDIPSGEYAYAME